MLQVRRVDPLAKNNKRQPRKSQSFTHLYVARTLLGLFSMARFKDTKAARVQVHEDEDVKESPRRTSTRMKFKVERQDYSEPESSPELENGDEQESDDGEHTADSSSLSSAPDVELEPEPEPQRKRRGRPKKSDVAKTPARESIGDITADIPIPSSRGRAGGNKRKHDHEYCLTCSHYGRACGGRRDGYEGCAVCREPNREKGEKLRECLWAEPDRGVFTYLQAREVLKRQQAMERAAMGKPPTKRQLQYLNESEATQYLRASDAHMMQHRFQQPPPVKRPLNLLPPPSAPNRASTNELHHESSLVDDEGDTIVVNTDSSEPQRPTQQIKLLVRSDSQSKPNGSPAPVLQHKPAAEKKQQSPPTDGNGFRIPYYDPNLNAYVLPAYPFSNLLPPHMLGKVINQHYISPYDAYPCIPVAVSSTNPPRPVIYQPGSAPPANSSNPRPSFAKPRPIDTSDEPVRKWSRTESDSPHATSNTINKTGWTAVNGGSAKIQVAEARAQSPQVADGKENNEKASEATSDLSSPIDMDVDMEDGGASAVEEGAMEAETEDGQSLINGDESKAVVVE